MTPFVHIITGLPSSGKTTFAELFQQMSPNTVRILNTDKIREALFEDDDLAPGDFTPEQQKLVYATLPLLVKELLGPRAQYQHVILDGTFRTHESRRKILSLREDGVPVSVVHVVTDSDELRKRCYVRSRTTSQKMTFADVEAVAEQYEHPESAIVIQNSGSLAELSENCHRYMETVYSQVIARLRMPNASQSCTPFQLAQGS